MRKVLEPCDEKCKPVTMTGLWNGSHKGKVWCSAHYHMINTCEVCGKKFHTDRDHTKTCGDKCRKKLSRTKV